jgi:hypothetical protein
MATVFTGVTATVFSGGIPIVFTGGIPTVFTGGMATVFSDGTATVPSGGTATVLSGSTATGQEAGGDTTGNGGETMAHIRSARSNTVSNASQGRCKLAGIAWKLSEWKAGKKKARIKNLLRAFYGMS